MGTHVMLALNGPATPQAGTTVGAYPLDFVVNLRGPLYRHGTSCSMQLSNLGATLTTSWGGEQGENDPEVIKVIDQVGISKRWWQLELSLTRRNFEPMA